MDGFQAKWKGQCKMGKINGGKQEGLVVAKNDFEAKGRIDGKRKREDLKESLRKELIGKVPRSQK